MWISRKTSNHMVPKDFAQSKQKRCVVPRDGEEVVESSDGKKWDDTGVSIIWETDTMQDYHKIDDPENPGQLINDPNFTLKTVPDPI